MCPLPVPEGLCGYAVSSPMWFVVCVDLPHLSLELGEGLQTCLSLSSPTQLLSGCDDITKSRWQLLKDGHRQGMEHFFMLYLIGSTLRVFLQMRKQAQSR